MKCKLAIRRYRNMSVQFQTAVCSSQVVRLSFCSQTGNNY